MATLYELVRLLKVIMELDWNLLSFSLISKQRENENTWSSNKISVILKSRRDRLKSFALFITNSFFACFFPPKSLQTELFINYVLL